VIDGRQRHDRSIASGEFVPLLVTLRFMPGMQLVGPTFARSSTRTNSGRCAGRVIAWILIAVSLSHVAQIFVVSAKREEFCLQVRYHRRVLLAEKCAHRGLRKYAKDGHAQS
jgi:hypothetical protein